MVCVNDVVSFVSEAFPGYEKFTDEEIRSLISEHANYGTISIVFDDHGVAGILRINIFGHIAEICDIAVRKGLDFNTVSRQMALELWNKFPYLKYFEFSRIYKYPLKKSKLYTIKRFMKLK